MGSLGDVLVGGLSAVFTDVMLPFGLTVNEVKLDAANATLSHKPFSVQLEQPGAIQVSVGEANLQAFLNRKAPGGLKDFQIRLDKGVMHVEASMKMFIEVRAAATCLLRIQDGTQLWVDLQDVEVLGVGAKGLVQGHLDKINPVMDVGDFPLKIVLKKVTVDSGMLILDGDAEPK